MMFGTEVPSSLTASIGKPPCWPSIRVTILQKSPYSNLHSSISSRDCSIAVAIRPTDGGPSRGGSKLATDGSAAYLLGALHTSGCTDVQLESCRRALAEFGSWVSVAQATAGSEVDMSSSMNMQLHIDSTAKAYRTGLKVPARVVLRAYLKHPQLLGHSVGAIKQQTERLKGTFKSGRHWVDVLEHKPELLWSPYKDTKLVCAILQQHGLSPAKYIQEVAAGPQNAGISPQLLEQNLAKVNSVLSGAGVKQTLKKVFTALPRMYYEHYDDHVGPIVGLLTSRVADLQQVLGRVVTSPSLVNRARLEDISAWVDVVEHLRGGPAPPALLAALPTLIHYSLGELSVLVSRLMGWGMKPDSICSMLLEQPNLLGASEMMAAATQRNALLRFGFTEGQVADLLNQYRWKVRFQDSNAKLLSQLLDFLLWAVSLEHTAPAPSVPLHARTPLPPASPPGYSTSYMESSPPTTSPQPGTPRDSLESASSAGEVGASHAQHEDPTQRVVSLCLGSKLLRYSLEGSNLRAKVAYFVEYLGLPVHVLLDKPAVLTLSFEDTIVPRCEFIRAHGGSAEQVTTFALARSPHFESVSKRYGSYKEFVASLVFRKRKEALMQQLLLQPQQGAA